MKCSSNACTIANANGYYFNACVIFTALTDALPVGLDPFKLSKEDTEFMQETA